MNGTQSFECNAPDVVFEHFGDEVILLNLQSGRYYSLDPIGMLFWEYLSQGVPPGDITAHIGGVYQKGTGISQIEADLETLVSEFQAEQLVRASTTSRSLTDVPQAKTTLPDEYARPVLSKFDDVAEMLLLDPVHDVTEAGWPNQAPAEQKEG